LFSQKNQPPKTAQARWVLGLLLQLPKHTAAAILRSVIPYWSTGFIISKMIEHEEHI